MLLGKNYKIRFNFLKLLDRKFLYFFRRRYVITSFLMTSRLRHHYVVCDNIRNKFSVFLIKWVFTMVHAKNYETVIHFVKVMQKKTVASFSPGHGVCTKLLISALRIKWVMMKKLGTRETCYSTMPAQQSGPRCLMNLEILTVLIVLNGSWKQFSLAATNLTGALEVIFL